MTPSGEAEGEAVGEPRARRDVAGSESGARSGRPAADGGPGPARVAISMQKMENEAESGLKMQDDGSSSSELSDLDSDM